MGTQASYRAAVVAVSGALSVLSSLSGLAYAPSSGSTITLATAARAVQADPVWAQQAPATSPPPTADGAIAYDSDLGRAVMFGGQTAHGDSAKTWVWNGSEWSQLRPDISPPARHGDALAYDPVHGQAVLFGGTSAGSLGDTWILTVGQWFLRRPATSPPPRADAAMAFDPVSQRVILFGGSRGPRLFGDTWSWDGTTWTKLSPAASPAARTGGLLAYDPTRGRLVLFGGDGESGQLNDTWSWDGAGWRVEPVRRAPPPGADAAMSTLGPGVVFVSGARKLATWILNPTTWRKVSAEPAPARRTHAMLTWDANRDSAVLFGGRAADLLGDTWALSPAPGWPIQRSLGPRYAARSLPYEHNRGHLF